MAVLEIPPAPLPTVIATQAQPICSAAVPRRPYDAQKVESENLESGASSDIASIDSLSFKKSLTAVQPLESICIVFFRTVGKKKKHVVDLFGPIPIWSSRNLSRRRRAMKSRR